MNNFQLRQILLEIQHSLRCMHCGKPYTQTNIHLKGTFKNMYLFQLICEDHAAFATITVVGQHPSVNEATLSLDDSIRFHQELQKFDGDFAKAFQERP